ncbi:hypothetical protein N7466_008628 [Penicillium verhagenii]|uniref:uncharacterized protein n=1 Tax=Penicillium verhagenii TaxID=1562060 RepID=UPI0025454542|nr:uncharacterized protein N7466_008628 [Penicillium verhagenii]KAJ5924441.1 hypothetical protein N7466_008628 [Penicillium verhagenii]
MALIWKQPSVSCQRHQIEFYAIQPILEHLQSEHGLNFLVQVGKFNPYVTNEPPHNLAAGANELQFFWLCTSCKDHHSKQEMWWHLWEKHSKLFVDFDGFEKDGYTFLSWITYYQGMVISQHETAPGAI